MPNALPTGQDWDAVNVGKSNTRTKAPKTAREITAAKASGNIATEKRYVFYSTDIDCLVVKKGNDLWLWRLRVGSSKTQSGGGRRHQQLFQRSSRAHVFIYAFDEQKTAIDCAG